MINSVIIEGRLTQDVELKKTQNGKSVASFNIACKRTKDNTSFIDCVAWNKTAEIISQYGKKGNMISTQGHLNKRSFQNAEGKNQYIQEYIVESVHFLGSKSEQNDPSETRIPIPQTNDRFEYRNNNVDLFDRNNDFEPLEIQSDDLPF